MSRAAESWARLVVTAPERQRLLAVLRAAAEIVPLSDATPTRSRLLAAVDALDADLSLLLSLGCPVAHGFDPRVVAETVIAEGK